MMGNVFDVDMFEGTNPSSWWLKSRVPCTWMILVPVYLVPEWYLYLIILLW